MNTQTENKTETEIKLNLLENLYIENLNIVDFIEHDFEYIRNADDLYEELNDNDAFNIDIIYYSRAMEYLAENDNSLSESIELAVDMGYELENVNSELLASLHASQKAREDFHDITDDINEILSR
jgi:hypothetical protein